MIFVPEGMGHQLPVGGQQLSATLVDAKQGWLIFRDSNYSINRDHLNERLVAAGYKAISKRMFRHYNKLHRFGYDKYLPINRLDISTLHDPLWDDKIKTQYHSDMVSVDVRLSIRDGEQVIELVGQTMQLGPSGATCVFGAEYTTILTRAVSARLVADFETVGTTISTGPKSVRVEEVGTVEDTGEIVAELSFLSYVPLTMLLDRLVLVEKTTRFTFTPSSDEASLHELVRKLYWLYQLGEAGNAISRVILDGLGVEHEFTVPTPAITKVNSNSFPFYIDLKMGSAVGGFMAACWATYQLMRYQHFAVNRARAKSEMMEKAVPILIELMKQEAGRELAVEAFKEIMKSDGLVSEILKSKVIPSLDRLTDNSSGKLALPEKDDTQAK